MKNSKEKNYKLKEKKWKLQEDLFCLLSYIIMIGTMVSMIFNPKINLSDNILLIVYITTVIIWLIFIKLNYNLRFWFAKLNSWEPIWDKYKCYQLRF